MEGGNRCYTSSERLAAIKECQEQIAHWTAKLDGLRAAQRRACKILRVAEDPHSEFSVDDCDDKDLVVAALQRNPWFFGCLREGQSFDSDKMAPTLHENPDVLLAFLKSVEDKCGPPEDFGYDYFFIPIPKQLRHDKQFMLQICSIQGNHYVQAAEELWQDPELALVAYEHAYDQDEFAEENLLECHLRNFDFVLQLVPITHFNFSVILKTVIPLYSVEQQHALALAMVEAIAKDNSHWARDDTDMVPLEVFDSTILDDRVVMEKFVGLNALFMEFCSSRLKSDPCFVKWAVGNDPKAVQFSMGRIREEFLSNEAFMSKAIDSSYSTGNLLTLAPPSIKEDRNFVLAAAKKCLDYSNLPDSFKDDEEIVLEMVNRIDFDPMCGSLRNNNDFIAKLLKKRPSLYERLPSERQVDPEIGRAVLFCDKFSYYDPKTAVMVFEKIPALQRSREALEALARKPSWFGLDQNRFCEMASTAGFLADPDFLCVAVARFPDVLASAPENLRWDPHLVSAALDGYSKTCGGAFPLIGASPEFLSNNPNLVLKAIRAVRGRGDHEQQLRDLIPSGIYRFYNIISAALQNGWNVLPTRPRNSSFRSNRKLIHHAVIHNWKAFAYASDALKGDRDFLLSIVAVDGRALKCAPEALKYDYEVLKAALSNKESVIAHAFNENDHDQLFLTSFASMIQAKLNWHETYLYDFLGGMRQQGHATSSPAAGTEERQEFEPNTRCPLTILECGNETSVALKRAIAEYADVPLGEELRVLRLCWAALTKSGF